MPVVKRLVPTSTLTTCSFLLSFIRFVLPNPGIIVLKNQISKSALHLFLCIQLEYLAAVANFFLMARNLYVGNPQIVTVVASILHVPIHCRLHRSQSIELVIFVLVYDCSPEVVRTVKVVNVRVNMLDFLLGFVEDLPVRVMSGQYLHYLVILDLLSAKITLSHVVAQDFFDDVQLLDVERHPFRSQHYLLFKKWFDVGSGSFMSHEYI